MTVEEFKSAINRLTQFESSLDEMESVFQELRTGIGLLRKDLSKDLENETED